VRLAAGPPPGYSRPGAALRLAYSYLITPHTLELHTSGVLASMSRDERDDAAGHIIMEWRGGAVGRGEHPLPEALVGQVRLGWCDAYCVVFAGSAGPGSAVCRKCMLGWQVEDVSSSSCAR
jgi:hypothetical protein